MIDSTSNEYSCFWPKCSDRKRCEAFGSCVAKSQAGGVTFPTMEPNNTPPTHLEIISAVAHFAREIVRLTEAPPVACAPETKAKSPLDWLNEECCALQPIAIATGGGDHDVHWIVVQYHMTKPVERTIGEGRTAVEAIEDARKDPNDPTRWAFVPPDQQQKTNRDETGSHT